MTYDARFDDDSVQARFDKALSACNRILAPLTKEFEVCEITERLLQQIETHMDEELCAIYNGPADDSWNELSAANRKLHYKLWGPQGRQSKAIKTSMATFEMPQKEKE